MLFTHFIINFPTETVEDFKRSLNIAKIFDYSIFLPYGNNALTPASKEYQKPNKEMLQTKTTLAEQALMKHLFNGKVLYEND
jgi:tRNA A37 methylthiotransferase MiaB